MSDNPERDEDYMKDAIATMRQMGATVKDMEPSRDAEREEAYMRDAIETGKQLGTLKESTFAGKEEARRSGNTGERSR